MKIIIIFLIIILLLYLYNHTKKINNNIIPDIIISPSIYYGFYTLGICHYIKKSFSIKDKKIFGFSSGTFNGLYLTVNKKKSNLLLKTLLKLGKEKNIYKMAYKFKKKIIKKFTINDFNKNLYIGLSHIKTLGIYNNFKDINELIDCCYGSSFIPYITIKQMKYFYKNKLTLDGAVYYKNFMRKYKNKNKSILFINPSTFGRYNNRFSLIRNLIKPKNGLYNLFLYGYHDAKKNHDYLSSFF